MSEDQGYRISFRELYNLVNDVSAKLDDIADRQSQQIVRVEVLEKALKVMWGRVEAKASNQWQVNLAIATSGIALLMQLIMQVVK